MASIDEGGLRFAFDGAVAVHRFDGPDHGVTALKAVDFLVVWEREVWLVEVKDPTNPAIPAQHRAARLDDFLAKVDSGSLISTELAPKARDSYLYLHLEDRVPDVPIRYLVLLAIDLDSRQMMTQADRLRRQLPLAGPDRRPWRRPFIEDALVFDIAAWNALLADSSVTRA